MKKAITQILFLSVMIFSLQGFSQMTTFRFSYDLGAFDIAGGMVQNPAGEFVIAGLNNSFGPYYGDAMKIDAAGNVVWAKAYTAGFATNFSDIKNVSTGGYIITGSSTSGGGGALLVRIDGAGAVLWAFRYQLPNIGVGNASNEYGSSVIETSDGGFLVGGGVDYFWDGSSPTTVDTTSALGFKVDASGNLLWSRVWTITTANPDEHYINDVAESADGYFFVGQSSEGSGTLSSNGDYPSNALIIKTTTGGALTYIRRWGAGNTTSQGINSAIRLTLGANAGKILLGGFDDIHAFLITVEGVGGTPTMGAFNRRINGAAFPPKIMLIQDIMECSDGHYSIIGTQIEALTLTFYTIILKINSSSGALIFGRGYAPIGLSSILPEGGLCTDQGYYVSVTDQQATGFNFNVIRTNTLGQTNDPASGCPGTSISPGTTTYSTTLTTPTSLNYNLMTSSSFVPVITNMTPTRLTHCFNAPAALSATSTSTNVSCNGGCNGTASVTASGGTAPYTYAWAPSGGTSSSATGLCANNYTCTITDNVGATTTQSFAITQPTAVTATQSQTNLSCNAVCNGSASVVASGGTPGYTYSWSPSGGTSANATGLCANSYTCTITDANSCPITRTFNITQPTAISASASSTSSACTSNTGTATTTASGGTGTLTYSWAPSGGTAATATGLAPGGYTCTITDANGCTNTASTTVTTVNGPSATLQSQTNVSCFGGNTGTATVNASGGTPGYTYSWSPSGGTAATGTGLSNGNYTCTITDAAGCTTTQSVAITQATAITATTSSTPVNCSVGFGTATVNPSGGTGPYTYSWAPSGGTSSTATVFVAGNYTCTITDAIGCSTTTVVVVSPGSGPTGTLQSSADNTCFGGSTGTATVSATGGTGPYTYSWSPSGGTAATASNLSAGTYTCTITDATGCPGTIIVTITEPAAVAGTTSSTSTGCSTSTGSATVVPSGGTGPYTYNWLPSGGTAATATGLAAGTYTCTITDANGCTGTASASVSSTGGPVTSIQSSSDVTCFGGLTGSGTIDATGNSPFTYSWSPSGGNAATATGLAAGTYSVTVTDVGGCVTIQTITITEPTQLVSTPTSTPATCGNTNGTADAAVTGGTGPYTYLWSNSSTTATLSNLAGGSYSVTVTDANGCTTTSTVVITNNSAPTVTLQSSSNLTCFGGTNGAATVTVTGGSSPYTYAWSPTGGAGATATGLSAGTYTVTVTASDGCVQTQTVTLTQPNAIVLTNASTDENCGNADGSASIAASGGTPGYTYVWSNASTNDTISNLAAGSYSVTATDANGCTSTSTVVVVNSGSAVADAGTSVTITAGQTTQLVGTGGVTYSWSPSTDLSCTNCQNPVASPTITTTYTLTVTDANGCTDTDTVTVIVDIACGEVYLPNAFSPNGDFMNDKLYVRGNCIKEFELQIYNRWGEKVFTTNDIAIGWDGTWRDVACEAAVFTYILKGTLLDGTAIDKKGNITLVK